MRFPAFLRSCGVLAAVLTTVAITPAVVAAQDSTTAPGPRPPSSRPIRLVVSGGLSVPTGGFSSYHDLGTQASASLLVRLFGQKLRLRPELAYTRFDVIEQKVRALAANLEMQQRAAAATARVSGAPVTARSTASVPKLPDLNKLRDGAISSLLGTFANVELPLGPRGFQPYLIGGIGAVTFRTDVTTVNEAIDGVQWAYNAGAGIRFNLGPLGGGLEARLRQIPVDGTKTFFQNVTTVPVSFSLVF
jgi:opacity protein-like surface antigen